MNYRVKIDKRSMKRLFHLLLLAPLLSSAQEYMHLNDSSNKGIHFEHELNWQQVQEKAKRENKYIFVECYATWCGPCKRMDKEVFAADSTGEFMNKRFVSVKLQMDSSKQDDANVQAWYAEAHAMIVFYKVDVLPTFLFFDSTGKIVHKGLGYQKAPDFINLAMNAANPAKQYYTLLRAYQDGKKDYPVMPYLANSARTLKDSKLADTIAADYLHHLDKLSLKEICTKTNLDFVAGFAKILTSKDKVFDCIYRRPAMADTVEHNKGFSERLVNYMVNKEDITPVMTAAKKDSIEPNWAKVSRNITHHFGAAYVEKNVVRAKVGWYRFSKDWKNYTKFLTRQLDMENIENIPDGLMSMVYLNGSAWDIFQYSDNKEELAKAVVWSQRAIEMSPQTGELVDTKANLLYKLGKKDDALPLEKKAVELSPKDQELITNLQKMEHGEPTW